MRPEKIITYACFGCGFLGAAVGVAAIGRTSFDAALAAACFLCALMAFGFAVIADDENRRGGA